MLVLNTDLWKDHRIIKVRSSSEWHKPDAPLLTNCILEQVKSFLAEATKDDTKMILIIDLSKGDFPPWSQALKIAKFFVFHRSLILSGLAFSLIYAVNREQRTWINRILSIYTPAKPVHIVESKAQLKQMINGHREITTKVSTA